MPYPRILGPEFIKLRRRRLVPLFLLIYVFWIITISFEAATRPGYLEAGSYAAIDDLWEVLGNFPGLAIAVSVLAVISSEHFYGTVRINLLAGYTKSEFIVAKLSISLLIAGFLLLLTQAVVVIVATVWLGTSPLMLVQSAYEVPFRMIGAIGFASLGFVVGIVVVHPAAAMASLFIYILLVERLIRDAVMHLVWFPDGLGAILPMETSAMLIGGDAGLALAFTGGSWAAIMVIVAGKVSMLRSD